MNQVQKRFREEVMPALIEEFNYQNIMQVPSIEKVVLNIGMGEANDEPKTMDYAVDTLRVITGQKPIITRAKKSVANFKLREGRAIGCKVTLRGERMWSLLDRLMNVALPRIRDFRGISPRAFDGQGNYTLGVKEQSIFPEVELDKIKRNLGFDVTIVTSATTDAEAKSLLMELGMPFTDKAKKPMAPKPEAV